MKLNSIYESDFAKVPDVGVYYRIFLVSDDRDAFYDDPIDIMHFLQSLETGQYGSISAYIAKDKNDKSINPNSSTWKKMILNLEKLPNWAQGTWAGYWVFGCGVPPAHRTTETWTKCQQNFDTLGVVEEIGYEPSMPPLANFLGFEINEERPVKANQSSKKAIDFTPHKIDMRKVDTRKIRPEQDIDSEIL